MLFIDEFVHVTSHVILYLFISVGIDTHENSIMLFKKNSVYQFDTYELSELLFSVLFLMLVTFSWK